VEDVIQKPMGTANLPKDVRSYTSVRESDKEMYEKICKKFNLDSEGILKVSSYICNKYFKLLHRTSRQAHVFIVTDYLINCYLHEAGAASMRISKKAFGKD
jgi:thiaminase